MSVITRGIGDVSIPLYKSSFFEMSPYYRAEQAYTMLPNHKNITKIERFNAQLQ